MNKMYGWGHVHDHFFHFHLNSKYQSKQITNSQQVIEAETTRKCLGHVLWPPNQFSGRCGLGWTEHQTVIVFQIILLHNPLEIGHSLVYVHSGGLYKMRSDSASKSPHSPLNDILINSWRCPLSGLHSESHRNYVRRRNAESRTG